MIFCVKLNTSLGSAVVSLQYNHFISITSEMETLLIFLNVCNSYLVLRRDWET